MLEWAYCALCFMICQDTPKQHIRYSAVSLQQQVSERDDSLLHDIRHWRAPSGKMA
jgi:hypothetical protein